MKASDFGFPRFGVIDGRVLVVHGQSIGGDRALSVEFLQEATGDEICAYTVIETYGEEMVDLYSPDVTLEEACAMAKGEEASDAE